MFYEIFYTAQCQVDFNVLLPLSNHTMKSNFLIHPAVRPYLQNFYFIHFELTDVLYLTKVLHLIYCVQFRFYNFYLKYI